MNYKNIFYITLIIMYIN